MLPPHPAKRAASDEGKCSCTQRARIEASKSSFVIEFQKSIPRALLFVRDTGQKVSCEVNTDKIVIQVGRTKHLISADSRLIPGCYEGLKEEDIHCITIPAECSSQLSFVPQSPWFSYLSECRAIYSLACASCNSSILHCANKAALKALPSEDWEELVDAWMCHGDQRLNASVVQGRDDVGHTRIPETDVMWINSTLLRVNTEQMDKYRLTGYKAHGPWEGEAHLMECTTCGAQLGGSQSLESPSSAQLLQLSVTPIPFADDYQDYFSQVISNYLVEQTDRHAVHHFAVRHSVSQNPPHLSLWVFQPWVEMLTDKKMVVCKILYSDQPIPSKIPHHTLELSQSHRNTLFSLLTTSTLTYPSTRRKLAHWNVGFLLLRTIL